MKPEWQPIETAPKDIPILGWCVHEADPYHEADTNYLTTYRAHCESFSHADDGLNIIEWGGEFDERSSDPELDGGYIPAWWFVTGWEFEKPANPTHWMPLPEGQP